MHSLRQITPLEAKLVHTHFPQRFANITIAFSQNLSNHSCTISHPPGIHLPDSYITHPATGFGAAPGSSDTEHDNFTWYDLHVQRPIPWVIAGAFDGGMDLETKVVCVAPNSVVNGSREPQELLPEASAGVKAKGLSTWHMVTIAATIFSALLAV